MRLAEEVEAHHMYLDEMLKTMKMSKFNLELLVSAATSCFWIRIIFMLMLTETFGPLLTIIEHMFVDLIIFFFLFSLELSAFACVGILCFGTVPQYKTFWSALGWMLEISMG